ncbi:hypothetical protein [Bradyrhizobium sp.]|uniref:hypothetical protein n=1 Tax=Bradyrhizobium sp. TaxID=376 RepID=UPI0025B7E6EC|nr:hypothetical protein [Bradyrhizobium sp.]
MLIVTIVVTNNNMPSCHGLRTNKKEGIDGRIDVSNRSAQAPAQLQPSRKAKGKGKPRSEAAVIDIDLDGLAGQLGYAVRRFQLWVFQDFIKTLAHRLASQNRVPTACGAPSYG